MQVSPCLCQVAVSCFNTHWEVCVCVASHLCRSNYVQEYIITGVHVIQEYMYYMSHLHYTSTCHYVVTLHVNIHCRFVNLLVDIYIYMINMTIIYIYFNTWGFNSKYFCRISWQAVNKPTLLTELKVYLQLAICTRYNEYIRYTNRTSPHISNTGGNHIIESDK